MATARFGPTATLLKNGKVLFAGGFYRGDRPDLAVAGYCCFPVDTELYDPDTRRFTATGTLNIKWADTATLLPNGKVLVSANVYDPSTGAFTATGYTTISHDGPTATLIMNGKVLIAGGLDGDFFSGIAELCDSATGAYARTGDMTAARVQHTATLLPDGGVLFAGGHNDGASAEIYDPLKAAFSRTASMPFARELHTATLLNDGWVLIAGGDDQRYWIPETILSSAELYTPAVLIPASLLLPVSGDGKGQGAILHANTPQVASSDSPATVGEALEIYLTGLGDGSLIPPQVSIGGPRARAGRPRAGTHCSCAADLYGPAEQRSHDWSAVKPGGVS
jgi:large repetitive protein